MNKWVSLEEHPVSEGRWIQIQISPTPKSMLKKKKKKSMLLTITSHSWVSCVLMKRPQQRYTNDKINQQKGHTGECGQVQID